MSVTTCPLQMIHTQFLPKVVTFEPIGLLDRDGKEYMKMLSVAKLIASIVRHGCKALLASEYSMFDPIVLDNSCQIRGFHIMLHAQGLNEEARRLSVVADKVLGVIQKETNKPHIPSVSITLGDMLKVFSSGELEATEEMIFSLQSHFLTAPKTFRMNADGSDVEEFNFDKAKSLYSKGIDPELLRATVDFCQKKLSEDSISFIQSQGALLEESSTLDKAHILEGLSFVEQLLPKRKSAKLERSSSSILYNFTAILLRIRDIGGLICLQKHARAKGEAPFGSVYQIVAASNPSGFCIKSLPPDQTSRLPSDSPIFVLEGFVPDAVKSKEDLQDLIESTPADEMLLANAALAPQFSSKDIEGTKLDTHARAKEQVLDFRERGKALGCGFPPRHFTIVHAHTASVDELRRARVL